jgi:hypothetical protein
MRFEEGVTPLRLKPWSSLSRIRLMVVLSIACAAMRAFEALIAHQRWPQQSVRTREAMFGEVSPKIPHVRLYIYTGLRHEMQSRFMSYHDRSFLRKLQSSTTSSRLRGDSACRVNLIQKVYCIIWRTPKYTMVIEGASERQIHICRKRPAILELVWIEIRSSRRMIRKHSICPWSWKRDRHTEGAVQTLL